MSHILSIIEESQLSKTKPGINATIPTSPTPDVVSFSFMQTSSRPWYCCSHPDGKSRKVFSTSSSYSYTPWRIVLIRHWIWRICRICLYRTRTSRSVIIHESFLIMIIDILLFRSNGTIHVSKTTLLSWQRYTEISTSSMADYLLVTSLPSLEPRTDVNASAWFVTASATNFLFYTHLVLMEDIEGIQWFVGLIQRGRSIVWEQLLRLLSNL